jgi:uncharacterized membrane protein
MEPIVPLAILIVLFVAVVVPILAIVAFVRVRHLEETSGQTPQLTSRIYSLEQRLAQLEKTLASILTVGAAPKMTTSGDVAPSAAAPEQVRPMPVGPAPPPFPETPPPTHVKSAPPPMPPQPTHEAPPILSSGAWTQKVGPTESVNFETLIAGRWMNYIGILAILFAVALFLK